MGRHDRPVKGYYSNQHERPDWDCMKCIHRKTCGRAAEGSFCTRYQSREPEPEGINPNELWERGEQVEF